MAQTQDELFQERIDEMMVLEKKIRAITGAWQKATPEMLKNMAAVNDSLHKINIASNSIATYTDQCQQHADRTRNVFMASVLGCGLVIAGMLWWAHGIKNDLDADQKEMEYLENLFRGMPEFQKVHGNHYVRIVKGTETNDLENDQGKIVDGRYAQIWYAS